MGFVKFKNEIIHTSQINIWENFTSNNLSIPEEDQYLCYEPIISGLLLKLDNKDICNGNIIMGNTFMLPPIDELKQRIEEICSCGQISDYHYNGIYYCDDCIDERIK